MEKDFHVLPTEMGKARKKPGENLEFPPFLCYSKERFRGKEPGKVLFSLPFFVFLRVYDEEKRNVPARRKAQIERMSQSMTKDMTTGSPAKLILKFTIPLIFGNLFQQFYSMVDTIIVGRYLGKEALAGVGSTGSVNYMIIGFCIGACAGFSIPVAQRFGARHFEDLRRFVGNIIWLALGLAAVLTVLTVLLCGPILTAMNTPSDIFQYAYWYIVIIFAGIPATIFYNILASLLRALGDSRTPVVFLVLASLINIALDFILVLGTPMGVAGAAVATVASQLISGIACLLFIIKRFEILHIQKDDIRPRPAYLLELCNMGLPMGLQCSITAIGGILLQSSVNGLGSLAVASVAAAGKLSTFFTCAYDAMGVSMSTYTGQNMGARRFDRIPPGLRAGMVIGSVYSISAALILLAFGKILLTMFVDASETAVINDAYRFLLTNAAFYIPLAAVNIYRLLRQGMGYSKIAMFAGVCEMAARSFAGLVLVPAFGFAAACFANPLAWIMADLFLIPLYVYLLRKTRRLDELEPRTNS